MSECKQKRYTQLYGRWRRELTDPTIRPLTVDEVIELERLMHPIAGASLEPKPQTAAVLSEISRRAAAAAKVDLEGWLRGRVAYANSEVMEAAGIRFGRNYRRVCDVLEELIYDYKFVPPNEVTLVLFNLLPGMPGFTGV
jgi:hypothetical protein